MRKVAKELQYLLKTRSGVEAAIVIVHNRIQVDWIGRVSQFDVDCG